jgi:Xaa-Pro dipeptidase
MKPGVRARCDQACQQVIDEAGFERNFRKRLGYSVGVAFAPDWGEGHIFHLSRGEERELRPDGLPSPALCASTTWSAWVCPRRCW